MSPSPPAFTLREDSARSAYSVKAGADRLTVAVTFDDEETGDPKSAVGSPLPLAAPVRNAPVRRPTAGYDDHEVTNVGFAVAR